VGYFHEAAYYDSDAQLLDLLVPFLRDGLDAGEPTVVALGEAHTALVRRAMPHVSGIRYLAGGELYARPAAAIHAYRQLMADLVADGASQIRIVGELEPWMFGPTWDWWCRYESAINRAYDDFPLWSLCAYDTAATPPNVLRDVVRTHPMVATPGARHHVNPDFVDPLILLGQPRAPADDPLQRRPPVIELTDPMPHDARHAVLAVAPDAVRGRELEAFLTAVSEAVTNAIRHGKPPVRVRLWTGTDRVLLTVTDHGPGLSDPFAGLLPRNGLEPGGLGLWLAHQLCSHVAMYRDDDSFTIRLTGGAAA
jgi:anti-sigma regulatory factor (Ser/Thr protein kinase)